MPSEKDNILEFNQYMKPDKMPNIVSAAIESLIKKQINVQIIWDILQQQKQLSIFLVDIQCQLYGLLIIQKTSIINFKKNKMLLLTKEELKSLQGARFVIFLQKKS